MRILDYEVREPISNGTLERVERFRFLIFFCNDDNSDNVMILLLRVKN